MTNTDIRTLLERACAKAVDIMLSGDVSTVRQGTGHHVVIIRTVESDEREARTIQRREEHAENARADTERELARVVDELAHVRETGAAELARASDDLVGAAVEIDALRAELARQTGIAVDHCARADAAEQMVVELRERLREAGNELVGVNDETAGVLGDVDVIERVQTALSRTEAVAGRWVPVGVAAGIAKRCDAAIAARDEAVREMHSSDSAARMLGDDFARVLRDCTAAERQRDEVGIQLAAAQAEIARMRPVVEAARTMSAMWLQDSPRMTDYHVTLASALRALDAVPGDALAPRITAALDASGIDSANVKGVG